MKKYRDPKTGAISSEPYMGSKCPPNTICPSCPLSMFNNRVGETCSDFIVNYPDKVAEISGLEAVYDFAMRMCDNDVDGQGERFPYLILERIKNRLVGQIGTIKRNGQDEKCFARIYKTELVWEDGLTKTGVKKCSVKAHAYIPWTSKNKGLINGIESGVNKEVSLSCSFGGRRCSICGKEIEDCDHVNGEFYDGKLCCAQFADPVSLYEWSFVIGQNEEDDDYDQYEDSFVARLEESVKPVEHENSRRYRLCEILDVDPDEQFTGSWSTNVYRIHNGRRQVRLMPNNWVDADDEDSLAAFISSYEDIVHLRDWTAKDIEDAKATMLVTGLNWIARDTDGALWAWKEEPQCFNSEFEGGGYCERVNKDLFSSLKAGEKELLQRIADTFG